MRLPALSAIVAIASQLFPSSRSAGEMSKDQLRTDLSRLCALRPHSGVHSSAERDELKGTIERLKHVEPARFVDVLMSFLRTAKRNREVPVFAAVLPQFPSFTREILRRIAEEPDPTLKARLINCIRQVKGSNVIKALTSELDDKRPASRDGGVSGLRVCDSAFNVIYSRVAHIRDLGFDFSSDMSDAIHPDVPVAARDARITELKSRLVAKFGPALNLPNDL
jgi:hypothetical protein